MLSNDAGEYKLAVVSDTHGNWQKTVEALQFEQRLTHLIFLGDHASDGQKIAECLKLPAYIVRGNCDSTEDAPEELIVALGDWRLLICHGHRYHVKQTLQSVYYRGLELGVDAVLYGHTHRAIYESGDVILINPGSMSRNERGGNLASWGILTLPAKKFEKNLLKYEKKTCQM